MTKKWSELNIEKFLKLRAISETHSVDKKYQYISILSDIPYEDLINMKLDAVDEMYEGIELFEKKPNLNKIVKFKYNLGGRNYYVSKDMDEITVAQYIDLQNCGKEDIETLLSIIIIPEGHKYNDGYDTEQVREDIMKHFLYEDGIALSAFFLRLYKLSLKRSLRYSLRALKKAPKELKGKRETMRLIKEMKDTIGSVI